MPTATSSSPGFEIPTIDISPFLESPTSPSALKVVSAVRDSCLNTGFFQLTGHGVPRSLQDKILKGSEAFFKLPLEEKLKLDRSKSVGASNRGYEVIQGQVLQEGQKPDLKEGFYIGKHIPASDPRVQKRGFLLGPNIWPDSDLVPESVFKEPMETYFSVIYSLALKVLDLIAAGMPYGPDVFKHFTSNDPVSSVRLLHYPHDPSNDERQFGVGAHTDFGAITLLLQDDAGGLQVWDINGERWVDVKPNSDAYVVNVGDMLQMWTGGLYKSSLHRVINRTGKDRYSVPFFFDGNRETLLKPLDGSKGDREPLTVEEHMRERFSSTYTKPDGKVNFKA